MIDTHKRVLERMFSITAFVRTLTYTRAPGLTSPNAPVELAETIANCQAFTKGEEFAGFDNEVPIQFVIYATELGAFARPRSGDYAVDTNGSRYVVSSVKAGYSGLAWTIKARLSYDDDYGSVAIVHGSAEDYGDLTAKTAAEDYGPLYT